MRWKAGPVETVLARRQATLRSGRHLGDRGADHRTATTEERR